MCVYWRQRFWPIWSFWTENAETIALRDAFLELSDSFASDVVVVALSARAVPRIERALLASLRSAQQADTHLLLADAELCASHRSRGICFVDARNWLYPSRHA